MTTELERWISSVSERIDDLERRADSQHRTGRVVSVSPDGKTCAVNFGGYVESNIELPQFVDDTIASQARTVSPDVYDSEGSLAIAGDRVVVTSDGSVNANSFVNAVLPVSDIGSVESAQALFQRLFPNSPMWQGVGALEYSYSQTTYNDVGVIDTDTTKTFGIGHFISTARTKLHVELNKPLIHGNRDLLHINSVVEHTEYTSRIQSVYDITPIADGSRPFMAKVRGNITIESMGSTFNIVTTDPVLDLLIHGVPTDERFLSPIAQGILSPLFAEEVNGMWQRLQLRVPVSIKTITETIRDGMGGATWGIESSGFEPLDAPDSTTGDVVNIWDVGFMHDIAMSQESIAGRRTLSRGYWEWYDSFPSAVQIVDSTAGDDTDYKLVLATASDTACIGVYRAASVGGPNLLGTELEAASQIESASANLRYIQELDTPAPAVDKDTGEPEVTEDGHTHPIDWSDSDFEYEEDIYKSQAPEYRTGDNGIYSRQYSLSRIGLDVERPFVFRGVTRTVSRSGNIITISLTGDFADGIAWVADVGSLGSYIDNSPEFVEQIERVYYPLDIDGDSFSFTVPSGYTVQVKVCNVSTGEADNIDFDCDAVQVWRG